MECNLGWNHMHDFKINWAHSTSLIWNHKYDFQLKLHNTRFNYRLYYIQFEIAQIQDLVTSIILLIQYWASLKLNSSIVWGGESKSFENKNSKIFHTILFVYHFPVIWLVTLNKPWNLIGYFVFSVACSLAGKKMWFKAKNGAIRE